MCQQRFRLHVPVTVLDQALDLGRFAHSRPKLIIDFAEVVVAKDTQLLITEGLIDKFPDDCRVHALRPQRIYARQALMETVQKGWAALTSGSHFMQITRPLTSSLPTRPFR